MMAQRSDAAANSGKRNCDFIFEESTKSAFDLQKNNFLFPNEH